MRVSLRKHWRRAAVVGAVAALAVTAAGIGASQATSGVAGAQKTKVNRAVSGTVTFDGIWTSSSGAKELGDVFKAFNKIYPNVKINYKPVGNNLPTVLATAVAGGHPPDIADIAQPGFIQQLADQNKLKPITYAKSVMARNFSMPWVELGTFNNTLYAVPFKAANKSLVWYNVPAFKQAGVARPKTWAQLLRVGKTLKASGVPAYSIGGADGWTLTDLFENLYLRTYGPAKYNALSAHKIKWTDKSVITVLKMMGQVLGDSSNIAGGTSGALQYSFNDSVTNAFGPTPKAAMVFEADFVGGVITSSTTSKPGTGFNVFTFPITNKKSSGSTGVEIAGDLIVAFRDTPAIEAFVKFLCTAPAANAWAKHGGFGTGNHNVKPSVYPDPITRATEAPILTAKSVVFDMSDLQPASFGSTTGQGEWGIFQKFLKNPKNVTGIAKQLEAAATAAYKKGK